MFRLQEVSSGAIKVQGLISGIAQSCVQFDMEEVYEGSKVVWMCIGDYFADGRLLGCLIWCTSDSWDEIVLQKIVVENIAKYSRREQWR